MQEAAPFLHELWSAADAIGVPLEGAISEYAPGQLELTLKHHADVLRSADDAILYKHAAKGVALKHGAEACFMAKPFAEHAGSGMHMHVSVNDKAGKNVFASEAPEGSPELRHAIGGMKALLADSMAILAPNANSYRRFRANSYAPVAPVWGVNNRTCAFRVPAGAANTRHIEHRVAGADAHPALALAVLLAAVHHGMTQKLDPGPAVTGDGYAHAEETGERIPTNWIAATDRFAQSKVLQDYLGEAFVITYVSIKRTEQERFFGVISNVDYDWYLRGA
jgi:glutamine synthetase